MKVRQLRALKMGPRGPEKVAKEKKRLEKSLGGQGKSNNLKGQRR